MTATEIWRKLSRLFEAVQQVENFQVRSATSQAATRFFSSATTGSSMVKTDPSPGWLLAYIWPL